MESNERNLKRDWPYPVVELFLGRCSPEMTLKAASKPDDRCEAQFYIGEWHLLRGNRASARIALANASAACPKAFMEHRGALAELRMTADAEIIEKSKR